MVALQAMPESIRTPEGPSVAGAGAESLRKLLPQLEEALSAQGVPVHLFRPGVDGSVVRERLRAVGREVPDEVVTWLEWHDGVTLPDGMNYPQVLPRFQFWSLATIVERIKHPSAPYGTSETEWNPIWVQFLGDNNGMNYLSDRETELPAVIRAMGPLAMFPEEIDNQAVSLCTPVAWWIEGLRNGWYKWDTDVGGWDYAARLGHPIERRLTALV